MEKEYICYLVGEYEDSRPSGVAFETFKIAQEAAQRFSEKEGKPYYIFERVEVVNVVGACYP